MAINYNKLNESKKTKKCDIGSQKVTVIEVPVYTLLKFKKLRSILASCVAKFTQRIPLSGQHVQSEKVPLLDMDGKDTGKVVETDTDDINTPEIGLIDKAVSVRQEAIEAAAEVLLDEEFLFEILATAVKEFKDEDPSNLLGPEGLTLKQLMVIAVDIVAVNCEGIEGLGKYLSLLTGKK